MKYNIFKFDMQLNRKIIQINLELFNQSELTLYHVAKHECQKFANVWLRD